MKAIWNGKVIAESDDTVVVEGNHYFPAGSLSMGNFSPNSRRTTCGWKGEVHYYDVTVDGQTNTAAAWYYPAPKDAAAEIRDRVAFWNGVEVVP